MTSPLASGPAAPGSGPAQAVAARAGAPGQGVAGRAVGPAGQRRPAADLFARVLRGGPASDEERAGEGAQAAQLGAASMMARWFRAESSAPAPTEGRRAAAGVAATGAAPRVLIGGGADAPEARIQINAGPCSGAEIRLRTAASGVIEAELLTPTASSRQTLAVAMDEVGLRLRAKGIHLRGATGNQGQGQWRNRNSEHQDRQDDQSGGDG